MPIFLHFVKLLFSLVKIRKIHFESCENNTFEVSLYGGSKKKVFYDNYMINRILHGRLDIRILSSLYITHVYLYIVYI